MQSIKVIYTRIFRIFAIVYSHHFSKLERIGAVSHLNTSFKHFLYFIWEYDIVANAELEALNDIVQEIKSRYNMARNSSANATGYSNSSSSSGSNSNPSQQVYRSNSQHK